MVNTPFYQTPRTSFLLRMLGPVAAWGVVLFFLVGGVAGSSFWTGKQGPTTVVPISDAAISHYRGVLDRVQHLPMFCVYGDIANDFQRAQCNQYWRGLFSDGGLALLPLFGMAFLFGMAWMVFQSFYSKMIDLTEEGTPIFGALVTDPARAAPDLFSWFYGLRPLTVALENGNQFKVYVSHTLDPSPGTGVVGYQTPVYMGQKRYVCLLHKESVQIR